MFACVLTIRVCKCVCVILHSDQRLGMRKFIKPESGPKSSWAACIVLLHCHKGRRDAKIVFSVVQKSAYFITTITTTTTHRHNLFYQRCCWSTIIA